MKILTIGNSFSDDTMEHVYGIAKSAGVAEVKLGNLYIGGCSLDRHATNAEQDNAAYDYRVNYCGNWSTTENYKMSDAIKSENWDFISLQQYSGSSGLEDTYEKLEYMIEYVRGLCPTAKLVWNMTWAYQQNSTHADFSKYECSQGIMYNGIVSAVKEKVLTNSDIVAIIPNGTAIQNARTSYVGDTLTRDGFHLSFDFGRYIAGLTMVHTLTGSPIDGVTYMPEGVDADLRKVAIEAATNAVSKPWSVTASAYPVEPKYDN